MQNYKEADCEFFKKVIQQDPKYRKHIDQSWQGIYVFTASGKLIKGIGKKNSNDVLKFLKSSKYAFDTMEKEYKSSTPAVLMELSKAKRFEDSYPDKGLILYMTIRDVEGLDDSWNQDFIWFKQNEVRQWVPENIEIDSKKTLPAHLFNRLVCFHFLDSVRGQTTPFKPKHIKTGSLVSKVVGINDNLLSLQFNGTSMVEERGKWSINLLHDVLHPPDQIRGFKSVIQGVGVYNTTTFRFESLQLSVNGIRWGATQHNRRTLELNPSEVRIEVKLDAKGSKIAPGNIGHYRWKEFEDFKR